MPRYRALISVPIEADNDEVAEQVAQWHAHGITGPDSMVQLGHVEQVTEVKPGGMAPARIVFAEPGLAQQIYYRQPDREAGA